MNYFHTPLALWSVCIKKKEFEYGTEFWRKIDTVMAIAGRGLYADDYLLLFFDQTIFYGRSMYKRCPWGISKIGGDGKFLRWVTLALATAILTDGITVKSYNEDHRTKWDISQWKAWALRTLGERAYSSEHFSMLRKEKPYTIGLEQFRTIVYWESFVTCSKHLTGESYLELSLQRSQNCRMEAGWYGVIECICMIPNAVRKFERGEIMTFLKYLNRMKILLSNSFWQLDHMRWFCGGTARILSPYTFQHISVWTATSGHSAAIFTLSDDLPTQKRSLINQKLKRTLVVNLARFSTLERGHAIAVTEATGLWGKRRLPWYLKFDKNPEHSQFLEFDDNCLQYIYELLPIRPIISKNIMLIVPIIIVGISFLSVIAQPILAPVLLFVFYRLIVRLRPDAPSRWRWRDEKGVGEAIFNTTW